MFPSVKNRFKAARVASAARRTADLALEFATLGEYRLPAEPPVARAPERDARRALPSAAGAPARPRATRLRPATPAARRAQPAVHRERISSRTGMRALAFEAHGARARRGARQRAGTAKPLPQPCLVGDPGGSGVMVE